MNITDGTWNTITDTLRKNTATHHSKDISNDTPSNQYIRIRRECNGRINDQQQSNRKMQQPQNSKEK